MVTAKGAKNAKWKESELPKLEDVDWLKKTEVESESVVKFVLMPGFSYFGVYLLLKIY